MEITNNEIGETRLPTAAPDQEPAALDIIRTETVLSRLPIHNLAKKGKVNIQILKTTADGKVDLKWIVSYSDRYGQARQLAYKLDTIVINQHIDEQARPLPKMICLGSLRDIADQLDLGGDTNKVRRALRQNASAFITAKFEYKGNDGSKKTLEADFTRYSVIFTGEQLPDGRRADAVYIILNEPYREVLNNAPVRPLDRAYMKSLPPAAQRFYEIISYKMFSAIKNDYPHAKIAYSEYCTFSAQLRHMTRQPAQDQMAKVIRHHKESGYITAVRYEATIDSQNQPDWNLYLTPGPKARAEFAAAHGGRKIQRAIAVDAIDVGNRPLDFRRGGLKRQQSRSEPISPAPTFDPKLIAEFTRRGITEKKASELLAKLKPGQDVLAQLEYVEQMVQHARFPITNPPGFYIRLIESNTMIPDNFETGARRKAREENERKERERRAAEDARKELEWEYDDYCRLETERFIEENPVAFEAIKDSKRADNKDRHPNFSEDLIESFIQTDAKIEARKLLALPSLEEFAAQRKQDPAFFLKPVAVSAVAEAEPSAPAPQETVFEGEAVAEIPADPPASMEGGYVVPELPPEPVSQPLAVEPVPLSEPVVELVSDLTEPGQIVDPIEPQQV